MNANLPDEQQTPVQHLSSRVTWAASERRVVLSKTK